SISWLALGLLHPLGGGHGRSEVAPLIIYQLPAMSRRGIQHETPGTGMTRDALEPADGLRRPLLGDRGLSQPGPEDQAAGDQASPRNPGLSRTHRGSSLSHQGISLFRSLHGRNSAGMR